MKSAGKRMIESAEEALAFAEGEKAHNCIVHIPDEINVRRIRNNMDMTQKVFADYFGVNLRTIQDWEQGRRIPTGASKNFLLVIDKEPETVRRVLIGT